jgi:hypothetical protein
MSQNNSTRVLAEQIGFLFLQNIEQAELIRTLQQELTKLKAERGDSPKEDTDK